MSEPDPFDRVWWSGIPITYRMSVINELCFDILGYRLPAYQGSWSTGVSPSAGTHAGSGAEDFGLGPDPEHEVWVLREHGGLMAYRRWSWQGDWPNHIHCLDLGDPHLSPAAYSQIHGFNGYLSGGDALYHSGTFVKDQFRRPDPIRPFDWSSHMALSQDDKQWIRDTVSSVVDRRIGAAVPVITNRVAHKIATKDLTPDLPDHTTIRQVLTELDSFLEASDGQAPSGNG